MVKGEMTSCFYIMLSISMISHKLTISNMVSMSHFSAAAMQQARLVSQIFCPSKIGTWQGEAVCMSRLHVFGDIPLQCSTVWTERTSEWSLSSVSELVSLQIICSVEDFATYVARVHLGAGHWSQHGLLQGPTCSRSPHLPRNTGSVPGLVSAQTFTANTKLSKHHFLS